MHEDDRRVDEDESYRERKLVVGLKFQTFYRIRIHVKEINVWYRRAED